MRAPQCLWGEKGSNAKTLLRTHLETLRMADPDFEVSDVNYFRSKFLVTDFRWHTQQIAEDR